MKKFICEYCGKEFIPNYRIKKNKILKFCSKQCKARAKHAGCIKQKWFNKTQVENVLKNIITENGRYLTKDEICKIAKISEKTLSKFNISVLKLNKECGMKKPKSVFENKIKEYFYNNYTCVEEEKTFDDCLSPKGYKLRFDIYLKNENILIEADGSQHYDLNNPNYSQYQQECDDIKNDWCLKNNVRLIRIPYTRKVTEEYVNKFIIN